jgi:hypothetical protein
MGTRKGLTKYIETPEKMWELFTDYKDSVKSNPRIVTEFHGKDGDEKIKPLERPLTLDGFETYCYDIVGCIEPYLSNRDERYTDYVGIITRIRKEIRDDQISGGMVGQYNSNLTARLNGLVDKKETEVKGEPRIFNLE